jgi:hypothetical protein
MNTKEEVENSPMFKIIKKATMRKYPWIKDIYAGDEEDMKKYSSMLFLDADIDAQQLADEKGWTMEQWASPDKQRRAYNRDHFNTVYLSVLFTKPSDEEARELQNDIDDEMKRIQKSDAIPSDIKINKTLGLSNFRYNFPPPQEQPTEPDNTTITN